VRVFFFWVGGLAGADREETVQELGIASESSEHTDKALKKHNPTKLAASVASFMALITDIDMMKRTMMEMEIDLDKMPLGALSRAQIEKGYKVLSDLAVVLADPDIQDVIKKQVIPNTHTHTHTHTRTYIYNTENALGLESILHKCTDILLHCTENPLRLESVLHHRAAELWGTRNVRQIPD
jgi:hypothetical protein